MQGTPCLALEMALLDNVFPVKKPHERRGFVVGHPSSGWGSLGRAPGWVPSAHLSQPEAQDERGQVGGGPTGRDRGKHRRHAGLKRRVEYRSTRV